MTANEENALKMDRAHVITDQPANYNPQADDIAMKNLRMNTRNACPSLLYGIIT